MANLSDSDSSSSLISIYTGSESELDGSLASRISIHTDTDSDPLSAHYPLLISPSQDFEEGNSTSSSRFTINSESDSDSVPDLEGSDSSASRITVNSSNDQVSTESVSLLHLSSMSGPSASEEDLFREARRAGPYYESSDDEGPAHDVLSADFLCTVCRESHHNNVITTTCGHSFHYDCLRQACQHQERCPNCRHEFSTRWLHQNNLGVFMTGEMFWVQFELSFGPPPTIGPLVPHQQRLRDWELGRIGNIRRFTYWWTREWIQDKLAEIRMRYQISDQVELTQADLHYCEARGIRRQIPFW